ncbi:MAG: hypothetical protein DMG15_00495 [Acidobacteria bacterium]|nr:MAG: hypothetical protein DMG15_00495 [Acidobacteriota bacterium]
MKKATIIWAKKYKWNRFKTILTIPMLTHIVVAGAYTHTSENRDEVIRVFRGTARNGCVHPAARVSASPATTW